MEQRWGDDHLLNGGGWRAGACGGVAWALAANMAATHTYIILLVKILQSKLCHP